MRAAPEQQIELVPLGPGFGVEIRGLDPTDLDADGDALFRRAFAEGKLVLFRDCELSEEGQVLLIELLGAVSMASPNMKGGRKFSHVSNVHKDGTLRDGEHLFHTDFMFMERPLKALLQELFPYHQLPEIRYEHRWRVGDYLVWDNRALQHARRDFDPAESRALHRVPIAG